MIQNIEINIRSRKSVRVYDCMDIEPEKKQLLFEFISNNSIGIFGNKVDFYWIDAGSEKFKEVKLGTYGVISGTKFFITAKINEAEKNFEDVGYCMEKVILFCTELNLGTCWLGGTYKRTAFSKAIDLKDNEIIPAVTPVGYFGDKKSIVDKLFRYMAESDKRKPFDELFYSQSFSQQFSEIEKEKYGFYLEMIRLAPSASNKQPWRILFKDKSFHFFLKRTPNYNNQFLHSDLQRIDMGIAMSHFELALDQNMLAYRWVLKCPEVKFDASMEYIASCELKI